MKEKYKSEQVNVLELLRELQVDVHSKNALEWLAICYTPTDKINVVIFIDNAVLISKGNSSQLSIFIFVRHKRN